MIFWPKVARVKNKGSQRITVIFNCIGSV